MLSSFAKSHVKNVSSYIRPEMSISDRGREQRTSRYSLSNACSGLALVHKVLAGMRFLWAKAVSDESSQSSFMKVRDSLGRRRRVFAAKVIFKPR